MDYIISFLIVPGIWFHASSKHGTNPLLPLKYHSFAHFSLSLTSNVVVKLQVIIFSIFGIFVFLLYFPQMNENIQYLSFTFWPFHFTWQLSSPSMLSQRAIFHLFYSWVVFHYKYFNLFVYMVWVTHLAVFSGNFWLFNWALLTCGTGGDVRPFVIKAYTELVELSLAWHSNFKERISHYILKSNHLLF